MARKYFGTDGIRGRANGAITPELALRVGQAAGLLFQRGDYRHRVVIGKDTRLSGYMIESALQAGFTSVGMDVLLLGPMPTPAVAMLTRSMRADLGVMISASHNAYEDNGIKLFGPDGFKLSDEVELEIEALMDADLALKLARSAQLGRAKRIESVHARYIEFAKRTLPRQLDLEGMRVVVDCANGAAYKVAPETLWELGAEVIAIGVEPDGFNINRDVGSTAPAALTDKVRELRADIGIALDGDADRVLIIDEKGRAVDGDQLMAVIARSCKEDGRLARPGIVATIMSNLGLERYLESIGLGLARTRAWLQCRRRAVRPHHPLRLHDDRRRATRRAPAPHRREAPRQAGERGLPLFRAAAADPEERPLPQRPAARGRRGRDRDRIGPPAARQGRAARHPSLRNRAGDSRDGRGRRPRPRRAGRRRCRRRALPRRRLSRFARHTRQRSCGRTACIRPFSIELTVKG
jgi:hypothetical protein